MEILFSIVLFTLAFVGLSLGVILRGKSIGGSCSTTHDDQGNVVSSCVCTTKDAGVCPSDNDLVRIAQLTHPDPKHHR